MGRTDELGGFTAPQKMAKDHPSPALSQVRVAGTVGGVRCSEKEGPTPDLTQTFPSTSNRNSLLGRIITGAFWPYKQEAGGRRQEFGGCVKHEEQIFLRFLQLALVSGASLYELAPFLCCLPGGEFATKWYIPYRNGRYEPHVRQAAFQRATAILA
jgi:hypothetical protein